MGIRIVRLLDCRYGRDSEIGILDCQIVRRSEDLTICPLSSEKHDVRWSVVDGYGLSMSSFSWAPVLNRIMAGRDVGRDLSHQAMGEVMSGNATDSQLGAFIIGLRTKGETPAELAGMVDAMMDTAVKVSFDYPVVDIVGTGGDGFGTFNISTTASFVAAGAGVKVAKHGNRAASSPTGSADLLEALGFDLNVAPDVTKEMVEGSGFGFFFAPRYHPAMRFVGPVRSELGVRTVFNFLGPLCNPAGARMCVGTSEADLAHKMIEVLSQRGVTRGFVVSGEDGMDEVSVAAPTRIHRLIDGEITEAEFTPEDFGVARSSIDDLKGGDATRNMEILHSVLGGDPGPHRDAAIVNAAPAVVLGGIAPGFAEAVAIAAESIDSGKAASALVESLRINQQRSGSHG
jgi:anthranilate phosphoribosyltransferase